MAKDPGELFIEHYYEDYYKCDYTYFFDDLSKEELKYYNKYKNEEHDFIIVWNLIKKRMDKTHKLIKNNNGGFKKIKSWLNEFNDFHDVLKTFYDEPTLQLETGNATSFPPYILRHILYNIDKEYKESYYSNLEPFREEINRLYNLTLKNNWPKNDLVFGKFLEIFDIYDLLLDKYIY